jgi:YfiR/HmsC-like
VARSLSCPLAAAGFAIFVAVSAGAQVRAGQYEVEAAFLTNFGKFVSWPSPALPRLDSPLIIGIVGEDPFDAALEDSIESHPIDGHPVHVVHLRWNDALVRCHILFITGSEVNHLPQILGAVAGFPVLTVADFDAFARRGGAIELKRAGDRVRFDINAGAASSAGLHISSKLLALALHVYAAGEVR